MPSMAYADPSASFGGAVQLFITSMFKASMFRVGRCPAFRKEGLSRTEDDYEEVLIVATSLLQCYTEFAIKIPEQFMYIWAAGCYFSGPPPWVQHAIRLPCVMCLQAAAHNSSDQHC